MVKFLKKINTLIIISVISVFLFNSCAEDPGPSLWQDPPSGLKPVITSISPDEALAGVTLLTIDGSNFSSTPHFNQVTFSGVPGEVVSASPNQLVIKAPNVTDDTVFVLASVVGSEPVSDTTVFKLLPAFAEIKKDATGADLFTEDIVPYGLTTDAQGNVYTSMVDFNVGKGIRKITPAGEIVPNGELVDFAPKGGETSFHQLNMYQNLTIIGARRVRAIFQITEGVAASVFVSSGLDFSNDIDFDQNQNIWVGGVGIFRVTPAKEIKAFPFTGNIRSVRIFNNYLYILATISTGDVIKRFPIVSSDSLGSAEDVFDIGLSVLPDTGNIKITGTDFDIAADGDIILGTTKSTEPIIVVHQDGSYEPLYLGVIPHGTRVYAFAWDPGKYLYFTREAVGGNTQTIMRLDMQKQGAPNYGR
jgi:hypothetical protein